MSARTTKSVLISACAVPVLVIGQFAMLAIVPVALVLIGTFRSTGLRSLRWWAASLAAIYAIPLAHSLSKDMHPIFTVLISLVAVGVVVAFSTLRRRTNARAAVA